MNRWEIWRVSIVQDFIPISLLYDFGFDLASDINSLPLSWLGKQRRGSISRLATSHTGRNKARTIAIMEPRE
jgi:hypothetical protein